MARTKARAFSCEVFILAGGLSTRMGRDKSRVRLGQRTLLQHVRAAAGSLGLPVRVIRRDAVARCGPLGGIYTALKRSRADSALFLACDMPFVSPAFLKRLLNESRRSPALFACEEKRAGFPFVLRRETALPVVLRQIARSEFSLQSLAKALRAKTIRPPKSAARQLINLNSPADLKKVLEQTSSMKLPVTASQGGDFRSPRPSEGRGLG